MTMKCFINKQGKFFGCYDFDLVDQCHAQKNRIACDTWEAAGELDEVLNPVSTYDLMPDWYKPIYSVGEVALVVNPLTMPVAVSGCGDSSDSGGIPPLPGSDTGLDTVGDGQVVDTSVDDSKIDGNYFDSDGMTPETDEGEDVAEDMAITPDLPTVPDTNEPDQSVTPDITPPPVEEKYTCRFIAEDEYGMKYGMTMKSAEAISGSSDNWTSYMKYSAPNNTSSSLENARTEDPAWTWPQADQYLAGYAEMLVGQYDVAYTSGLLTVSNYGYDENGENFGIYNTTLFPMTWAYDGMPDALEASTENEIYVATSPNMDFEAYCLTDSCSTIEGLVQKGDVNWPTELETIGISLVEFTCSKE